MPFSPAVPSCGPLPWPAGPFVLRLGAGPFPLLPLNPFQGASPFAFASGSFWTRQAFSLPVHDSAGCEAGVTVTPASREAGLRNAEGLPGVASCKTMATSCLCSGPHAEVSPCLMALSPKRNALGGGGCVSGKTSKLANSPEMGFAPHKETLGGGGGERQTSLGWVSFKARLPTHEFRFYP